MSDNSFLKRRWKLLLNLVTTGALVILAISLRRQLGQTFESLHSVDLAALVFMIPLQFWNYDAQTRLFISAFKLLGHKLQYRFTFGLALELNFINNVLPSGGVSGGTYFAARLKSRGVSYGKATFGYVMKLAMVFFAFEILLAGGLICLAIGGRINNIVIVIATFVSTITVVLTVLFGYIVGSQRRINATFGAVTSFLNRVIHIFRRHHPETINLKAAEELFNEFHDNYRLIISNYKELIRMPLLQGLFFSISECATIYVVYVAFGQWVNPGAIVIAYSISNFAGLIAALPGGLGVYEAIMTGALVATGIPLRISLPVTIMYRVINSLIQLPPGYILYNRSVRRGLAAAPVGGGHETGS